MNTKLFTRRRVLLPVASVALVTLLAGCGGGGGNTGATTVPTATATPGTQTPVERTRVAVTWQWPDLPASESGTGRAIPRYARSLKITVQQYAPASTDPDGSDGYKTVSSQTVARPDNGGTARVEFADVPRLPGQIRLMAQAYEGTTDASQLSAQSAAVSVAFPENGTPPDVVLTLQSVAARLEITAPAFAGGTFANGNLNFRVGDAVPLTITARDNAGNVVLLDPASELRFDGDAANGNYVRLEPTTGGYIARGVTRSPETSAAFNGFRPGRILLSSGLNSGGTVSTLLNVRVKTRIEFTDVKSGIANLSAAAPIIDFLPQQPLKFNVASVGTEGGNSIALNYKVEVRDVPSSSGTPTEAQINSLLQNPATTTYTVTETAVSTTETRFEVPGVLTWSRNGSAVAFIPKRPGKVFSIIATDPSDNGRDSTTLVVATRLGGTITVTGPGTVQAGTTATFVVRDANGQLSPERVSAFETVNGSETDVSATVLTQPQGSSSVNLTAPLDIAGHVYTLKAQGAPIGQVTVSAVGLLLTPVDTAPGGVRKQITAQITGLDNPVNGETGRTALYTFNLSGDTQNGLVKLTPTTPNGPVASFVYDGIRTGLTDAQRTFTVSASATLTIGGRNVTLPLSADPLLLTLKAQSGSGTTITIN